MILNELNQQKKTLSELEAKNVQHRGDGSYMEILVTGISNNSKNVRPGHIFFAIGGNVLHGAHYANQALERGANLIITDSEGARIIKNKNINSSVMVVSNPRQKLAEYAASWNGKQPDTQVAITGTNGKTSVCNFVLQLWQLLGKHAASIGTLGVHGSENLKIKNTTPDPLILHQVLKNLVENNVEYVSMEASSHGLDQNRLDGVNLKAAAFTNLSRDHLDYHRDVDEYFAVKCLLFDKILPSGQVAVLNMDDPYGSVVKLVAENRGQKVLSVGSNEKSDFRILDQSFDSDGQILNILYMEVKYTIYLNLIGKFQATNVLLAAALTIGLGAPSVEVFNLLHRLRAVPGRMELVGTKRSKSKIFVDYAHTPDALLRALRALKPHTVGNLILVFGAGGERDQGKRQLMGKVAEDNADRVIITDDNPRNEKPEKIRNEILSTCPRAIVIPDRAKAILTAIDKMQEGDVLLIAGKGHETGQIVGDDILPFNDREVVSISLASLEGRRV